jgi:hypothetical protein
MEFVIATLLDENIASVICDGPESFFSVFEDCKCCLVRPTCINKSHACAGLLLCSKQLKAVRLNRRFVITKPCEKVIKLCREDSEKQCM